METAVKVIRRYSNRKLYDPQTSQYVTSGYVLGLVTEGQPFRVVEHESKEDVTTSVLLNALVEQGKNSEDKQVASLLTHVATYLNEGVNNV